MTSAKVLLKPKQRLPLSVRPMARQDVEPLLKIERVGRGDWAWERSDFHHVLGNDCCNGLVATLNHRVVGFVVFQYHSSVRADYIELVHLAVDPQRYRQGVGSHLLRELDKRLNRKDAENLKFVRATVAESALHLQQFLRANDFVCQLPIREDHYGPGENGYRFRLYRSK
jgi:ribosomal-protein-alanine N-acetyltransferase